MFLNGQGRYAVLWETMIREGGDMIGKGFGPISGLSRRSIEEVIRSPTLSGNKRINGRQLMSKAKVALREAMFSTLDNVLPMKAIRHQEVIGNRKKRKVATSVGTWSDDLANPACDKIGNLKFRFCIMQFVAATIVDSGTPYKTQNFRVSYFVFCLPLGTT